MHAEKASCIDVTLTSPYLQICRISYAFELFTMVFLNQFPWHFQGTVYANLVLLFLFFFVGGELLLDFPIQLCAFALSFCFAV